MDKQTYLDRGMAEVNEWRARIGLLRAKLEKQKAQARARGEAELDKASVKLGEVERRLQEARESAADAWDEFKLGFENASKEMKDAFSRAKDHVES
jgi:hypothetical protein